MEREVWVSGTESGDEVIFEGVDSSFRSVAAVDMRWDKLQVNILGSDELLKEG